MRFHDMAVISSTYLHMDNAIILSDMSETDVASCAYGDGYLDIAYATLFVTPAMCSM